MTYSPPVSLNRWPIPWPCSLEAYEGRLRFLNLKKQQFLRDTVSLLIDFGQMVDKAQQEFELEMGREQGGTEEPPANP